MKSGAMVCVVLSLMALAGCASGPGTVERTVRPGMPRAELKVYFGEPLRVEPDPAGGEDWYYKFAAWKAAPTPGEAGISVANGQVTHYVSGGLEISKETAERAIHISPEGYVMGPVPGGKVVKN